MNKLLKWILAILGIFVIVLVVAAVVLPKVIDPNNYKDDIRAAVLEKTGRELTIGGEIKWTVFPSIGLGLSDLELSNRSGFGDQPMLNVGAADASVKLMPLFSRKIEIGKVSLTDVTANLRRKANGQNNWEDLSGKDSGSTGTSSSGDTGFDNFQVSGIEISNANVSWDDAGQITELKGFGLTASHIELGRPVKLEGGFSVNLVQSQLDGKVKFGGLLQSEADGSRYGIKGLDISFKGNKGTGGESRALEISVNTNAEVDLNNDKATLSDFVLEFHDLLVSGALNVTSLSKTPRFEGQLNVAEFNAVSFMNDLGMEAPQTAADYALTKLQADMSFAGTANSANMRNLTLNLDKSVFKGNFKLDNFDAPRVAFDLKIDSINLDDYLPESESTSAGATDESDLSVDVFRGFTGGGDFQIGKLIFAGLTATDVSLKMNSNGNKIRLFPISAQFYGGKHAGDITFDASGNRPMLITTQQLTGVQVEGLLQDMTGSARLQGNGDIKLNIRTDLTNARSTRQALAGDMGISFLNGSIVGFNIAESIRGAKSLLGKQTEAEAQTVRDPKTDFSELSMSGVIEQGVLRSDDLKMLSPLLRVSGKGSVNLVDESIDYLVEPVLVGDLKGQGAGDLGDVRGIPIPVRLTGSMLDPDIKVDIVAAMTGSQKELINEQKDALIGKLLGGGKDDSGSADQEEGATQEDSAAQKEDPVQSLLGGILGGNKNEDKEKKKNKKKNKKNKTDEDGSDGNGGAY